MKILLAVDSSNASRAVVDEVAGTRWPEGSTFRVITIVDLFTAGPNLSGQFGTLIETEVGAAEDLVKSVAARLAKAGIECETVVSRGYPPGSIVEYAKELGADLILVGSHGRSALARFLVGSVAQAVLKSSSSSVQIVRPRSSTGRSGLRILLATDGSIHSMAAAKAIADRPWPEKSELRIMSVEQVSSPPVEAWGGSAEVFNRLQEELTSLAREAVRDAEKAVAETGLKISTTNVTGSPKSAIVEEAERWGADLVFLGSHGRRGVNRMLMGSVSEAVALHAPCSVEVVRVREPEEQ